MGHSGRSATQSYGSEIRLASISLAPTLRGVRCSSYRPYLASSNPIFKWRAVIAIIGVSSCSLEMFSMSAVLSVAFSIIAVVNHPSFLEKLVLDSGGMLLMGVTAVALTIPRRLPAPGRANQS